MNFKQIFTKRQDANQTARTGKKPARDFFKKTLMVVGIITVIAFYEAKLFAQTPIRVSYANPSAVFEVRNVGLDMLKITAMPYQKDSLNINVDFDISALTAGASSLEIKNVGNSGKIVEFIVTKNDKKTYYTVIIKADGKLMFLSSDGNNGADYIKIKTVDLGELLKTPDQNNLGGGL